jgi:hypothetical protein
MRKLGSVLIYNIGPGLSSIRVDGYDASSVYNLTIPPFSVGTTDVVGVVFNADCCVRKIGLTVFDVAGNVNATTFDQGPIKGTKIVNSTLHLLATPGNPF